jgi:hypothetical protein
MVKQIQRIQKGQIQWMADRCKMYPHTGNHNPCPAIIARHKEMLGKDGPKSSMSPHCIDIPMTTYCQSIKEYKQQQGYHGKKPLFFLNFKDLKRIRHFFFLG